MSINAEKQKLDFIAKNSLYAKGMSAITQRYCCNIFMNYMKDGSVLELGPAEGIMTEILYENYSEDYSIVDGGEIFISDLKKRFPKINGTSCLFEEFIPNRKFDNIILGHVLEHVINPTEILVTCKNWLEPDGVILASVPNSNSLHRQAAVEMGLLGKTYDLNEKDKKHGHRRVFDLKSFEECFTSANINIVSEGGYWLKPLSDSQIEESWTDDIVNAYLKLGEKYPEIAGEIYIIGR